MMDLVFLTDFFYLNFCLEIREPFKYYFADFVRKGGAPPPPPPMLLKKALSIRIYLPAD